MKNICLAGMMLACMATSSLFAQESVVNKIIEMGQNDNQVMHHLDILTNRLVDVLSVRMPITMPVSGC